MFHVSRRAFLGATATGASLPIALLCPAPRAHAALRWIDGGLPESFPAQDPKLAAEIVGKSHFDLDAVRELVTARPALAKAAWDWGFGDWETALGAASHVGRADIAQLLIAHGARPDLFTFTMLGQVDIVRAICTANPGIQRIHGPHGITLLQHAVNGGDHPKSVADYLRELGDADLRTPDLPLDADAAKPYVGDYRPDIAPDVVFHIVYQEKQKCLTFARDTPRPVRFLHHQGDHAFSPRGAPAVRITFEVSLGAARSLAIRDGDLAITAQRVIA